MRAKKVRPHLLRLAPGNPHGLKFRHLTYQEWGFQLREIIGREYRPKRPWENGNKMRKGIRVRRWHHNIPDYSHVIHVYELPRPFWVQNIQYVVGS